MDENQQKINDYISAQLQSGQTPDEISGQLTQSGWSAEQIRQAFITVQRQVLPTNMQETTPTQQDSTTVHAGAVANPDSPNSGTLPQANGRHRGRIKTGWMLLKHSLRILNGNRYLLRYFVMTWVFIIVINAAVIACAFLADPNLIDSDALLYGIVLAFYLITFSITNFYAAALASNIFDIYKGVKQPYAQYVKAARGKFWPIFTYSLISAIIGTILEYIIERFGRLGMIIAWLIGTAWSVSTMFVLPIIMDSKSSAPSAIKQSLGLLKQTWGEGITAKVTVNTPLALIQIALAFIFFWAIWGTIFTSNSSWALVIAVFSVYLFISLSVAVIGSFANSLINVALYYYAVNKQVPPSFSEDMLNQVMIKGRRRLFRRDAVKPVV